MPRPFLLKHHPPQRNILIDAGGNARLHDFANCSFMDNTNPANPLAPIYTPSIRWSAPELLGVSSQPQEPTKMSDIYSLSMVIVEVCPLVESLASPSSDRFCLKLVTGKAPFPECTDQNVIFMIAEDKRPVKPRCFGAPGMTPEVWEVAQNCWNKKPSGRLEIDSVIKSLEPLTKSGVFTDELPGGRIFTFKHHRQQTYTYVTPPVEKIVPMLYERRAGRHNIGKPTSPIAYEIHTTASISY